VPTELQLFAKENHLKLLTHNDPSSILSDERLGKINSNLGRLEMEWAVRYQVMDAARGVLKDKRYIVGLKASGGGQPQH
jgi:hypothetical protein